MDVFVEQIVKKKMGSKDMLMAVGVTILGAVLVFASAMFVPGFSVLVLAGVIYGAWFLISSRNLEYEYSCTNGDFTVDKIINRRRRKRVVAFDLRNVEDMGKYATIAQQNKNFDKKLFVGNDDAGTDAWYMTVRAGALGNTLIVFNPDERVLAAIKPFIPKQLSFVVFGRH